MELPAFVAVAVVIVITPGPDMAIVTRNALAHGRGAALMASLGITAGLLVWTVASVAGLAALLASSSEAFTVVKWLGAAYLAYLGLRTLLSLREPAVEAPIGLAGRAGGGSPFRQGLLSNLLNPKIAVLFTSLIPQFVSPGPSATIESVALAGVFAAIGLVWLVAYSIVASTASEALSRPPVRRAMNAITGVVLLALGVRMAAEPVRAEP
jgi:threonine/homoserine/homoserine lactone efflux protein